MITRFHVQNYKALRDVALDLTPIHVLIGPNDSGKTSIVEALYLLSRLVHASVESAFEGRWQGRELVWRGSPDPKITVKAVAVEGNWQLSYEFTVLFHLVNRQVQKVRETAQLVSPGQPTLTQPQDAAPDVSYVARIWSDPRSADQELAKRIHDMLHGAQLYHWVPAQLALPVAFQFGPERPMENSGFGLAMCLNDILTYDYERFGQLEQRFQSLFPDIAKIRLRRETAYVSGHAESPTSPGLGIYFELADSSSILSAAQASDGLLVMLAYLAIFYSPHPPRLLLIEEPENGIHPQRLAEVLQTLRELVGVQSRTQVVLTTHSPYLVDQFEPQEVTLCLKGEDGAVRTHRLSTSKSVREQIDIFKLGEIWMTEGDAALAVAVSP